MEFYQTIKTRKSVRSFQDRAVEKEKLYRILEAARIAPSAHNNQEWRFVVSTDPVLRRRMADEAAGQSFVGQAPVLITACADTDYSVMPCGQMCYPLNVAIAVDHLTLAAAAEGLGTCWIGAFDAATTRRILGIPDDIIPVALLLLGYPMDPQQVPKRRLNMEQIIHEETW